MDNIIDINFNRPMFIFRHPKTSDVRNGFLKPFSEDIWWLILIFGTICWISLYFAAKIEIFFRETKIPDNTLMSVPASETGLITMAAISQQGNDKTMILIN